MELTKLICLFGATYLLFACSSTQQTTVTNKPTNTQKFEQAINSQAQLSIEKIAKQFAENSNINQRNSALLQLADQHIQNQDCASANIIIKHTQATIQEQSLKSYANLLKAECLLVRIRQLNNDESKEAYLSLVDSWLNEYPLISVDELDSLLQGEYSYNTRLNTVKAQYFALYEDYASALTTLLGQTNSVNLLADANYSNLIWDWYSLLNQTQRETVSLRLPSLQTHKLLLDIIEDETISDSVRQTNLKQWLANNPNSALAQNTPKQLSQYLALNNFEEQNIAVLLPLSGRLSIQGQAIKQGLLAAYYQRLEDAKLANSEYFVTLEFIDTGSFNEISNEVTQETLAGFDTIVGPLLKSHIEVVKKLAQVNSKQVALNFLDDNEQELPAQFAMFSLSPEQEAEQLVALMRGQKLSKPILITDTSSLTQRMSNAFIDAWQKSEPVGLQSSKIQEITFTNNNSMRVGITSALDVLQSQKRIQQISNLTEERVISVTRNRRDVDAFVVFARPDDVELINPIIESSISLFSDEQTPVFATSFSYDHKQNKNSQRDLRNLVFTDMPFMLPSGRESELSQNIDVLFNKPSSAFLRLFAFGYDALLLVDNLAKLSTFSHMKVLGLSGEMSIDAGKQVNRTLPYIVINDEASEQ